MKVAGRGGETISKIIFICLLIIFICLQIIFLCLLIVAGASSEFGTGVGAVKIL